MIWIIILIYLIIAGFTYKFITSKWDNQKWENIAMGIGWPLLIPLYGVYWLHKNL